MYTRCHTHGRPSYERRASAKRNLPWCASWRGVGGVVAAQYSAKHKAGQRESPLRASNHATGLVWLVCAPVKERHASQNVLPDVGECSMATGTRKREGGQLAKKSLRGAMRRRRRRISRSNPRPPLSPVLLCRFAIPYDVHSIRLLATCSTATACKGRLNQVGETTGMVLGGRAWDVPKGRTAGAAKRGRGRAVLACAVGAVTHFPHLIATHLHYANATHLQ